MYHLKRNLLNIILGAVTCLCIVNFSSPSLSYTAPAAANHSIYQTPAAIAPANTIPNDTLNRSATRQEAELQEAELQEAEALLLAQGAMSDSMTRYVAVLSKANVVPTQPMTTAIAAAGAVLSGDRLVVRGDFRGLSSPLRDYAVDPVSPPNPNITSAVHIHQGEPTANGPFQYALQVTLDDSGLQGRFAGEYTLTPEQLQALANGGIYMDIHTSRNRAGELRGILQAY